MSDAVGTITRNDITIDQAAGTFTHHFARLAANGELEGGDFEGRLTSPQPTYTQDEDLNFVESGKTAGGVPDPSTLPEGHSFPLPSLGHTDWATDHEANAAAAAVAPAGPVDGSGISDGVTATVTSTPAV